MDEQRDEVAELLGRVREQIRASRFTQRDIELRAGFSSGYLSQVLNGHVEIKFRHLLAILDVLGDDPGDFFAKLFAGRAITRRTVESRSRSAVRDPMSLQLARLYGYGIESLADLEQRIVRCEQALDELRRQDLID